MIGVCDLLKSRQSSWLGCQRQMCWYVLVVFFHPDLSRLTTLSSVDLITSDRAQLTVGEV
jgi:hypothetical protein